MLGWLSKPRSRLRPPLCTTLPLALVVGFAIDCMRLPRTGITNSLFLVRAAFARSLADSVPITSRNVYVPTSECESAI